MTVSKFPRQRGVESICDWTVCCTSKLRCRSLNEFDNWLASVSCVHPCPPAAADVCRNTGRQRHSSLALPPSLHLLLVPVPTHPSSPSPIFFHELIYGANAASTLLCLFPPVLIIKTVSMLRVSSARSILNITSVTLSHPPSLPLPRLLLPL